MVWTLITLQQQRGAQLHARSDKPRAPGEAVRDRAAQDHEQAGPAPQPGESPASPIEHRDGQGNTPGAAGPRGEWDDVVQPERQVGEASHDLDDPLVPEGK